MLLRNLRQLVEAHDKGVKGEIISFGKHKGKLIDDIPRDYVDWARAEIKKPTSSYKGAVSYKKKDAKVLAREIHEKMQKEVQTFFLLQPKELHNLYIKSTSKACGVELEPFYDDLGKEEQRIWEEMSSELKEFFITRVKVWKWKV